MTKDSARAAGLSGLIAGALISLLAFAPAHWLALVVEMVSQQRLQLLEVEGTVWSGSASLRLSPGPGSREHADLPGRIRWVLSPQVWGMRIRLYASCCTVDTSDPAGLEIGYQMGWQSQEWHMRVSQSVWPADLLRGLGTPWNTIALNGELHLQSPGITLQRSSGGITSKGHALVQALNLSSPMSTLKPLGSYQVRVDGTNGPQFEVSTINGALNIAGHGQWIGAKLRFNGVAQAAQDREAALNSLLNLLGTRKGSQIIISLG